MSGEVLREFLVKLGYEVDKASDRKFSNALASSNKKVLKLGATVAGLAVIAEEAIRHYAGSMEKLHYTTVLTNSSAKGIDALGRAVERFGVTKETLDSMVGSFAEMVTRSPGIEQLVNSLGRMAGVGDLVDVDKSKEFVNILTALDKLDPTLAIRYAEQFHIPAEQFRLMRGHAKEISDLFADIQKKQIIKEEDAERGREYANAMKDVHDSLDRAGNAAGRLAMNLGAANVPKVTAQFLDNLSGVIENPKGAAVGGIAGWFTKLSGILRPGSAPAPGNTSTGKINRGTPQTLDEKRAFLRQLDREYNLPEGTLGGIFKTESGEGLHLKSSAGALGPFQMMPATAARYGVKNPMDFLESSQGAAKYMADLVDQFGNLATALAAYNAGEGRVAGALGGKGAPLTSETLSYPGKVLSNVKLGEQYLKTSQLTLTQTNHISIHGVSDPKKAAQEAREGIAADLKALARNIP